MNREKFLEFLQDGVEKPIKITYNQIIIIKDNTDTQKIKKLMEDFDERNST